MTVYAIRSGEPTELERPLHAIYYTMKSAEGFVRSHFGPPDYYIECWNVQGVPPKEK